MHRNIQIYLCLIVFCSSNFAEKLRYVQVIWRHGDRAPLDKAYPGDLNDESNWPRGWGQLTIIVWDGMRQMKELGQFLRDRYVVNANFLSAQFKKKEIIIRSTDVDRALESAQSLLSGMFPPQSERERFDATLNWEPIAVHANRDTQHDPLLNPSSYPCSRYKHLQEAATEQNNANLLQKYKSLVDFVRPHLNIPEGMPLRMAQLVALRHINPEIIHNLPQPKWVLKKWSEYDNKTTIEVIMEIRQKSWLPRFNGNEEITRLNAGFLLSDLLKRLNKVAQGKEKLLDADKMVLYSSHDSTLLGLLSAFNVKVPNNALDLPPYAGCVVVDLYENELRHNSRGNKIFFVKLFYRRNRILEPLIIDGCDENCDLDKFLQIVEPRTLRGGEEQLKILCEEGQPKPNSATRLLKKMPGFVKYLILAIFISVAAAINHGK